MNRLLKYILFVVLAVVFFGCTTQRPFYTDPVTPGINSYANDKLKELPEPAEKIVAAVYRFRDQTGQYKPSDVIASWSTAVTQGATSILIKSMEDSGWFIPIEREGLSNLLNERQIISQIRAQNAQATGRQPEPLPPLLFAGIILEGGIVGYDTNVMTGGMGARYLGTGASQQIRKDQITIYLRAVSSQSGRVLKTIHTSKSIISYQLESGAFRYIDTNRLLEAEIGYSYNEPPVLAVTEAIDEALRLLVLEGIEEQLWAAQDSSQVNEYLLAFEEKESEANQNYFGLREEYQRSKGFDIGISAINSGLIGNYQNTYSLPGIQLDFKFAISDHWSINTNLWRTEIGARNAFRAPLNGADFMLSRHLLKNTYVNPFVGMGASIMMYDEAQDFMNSNTPNFAALASFGLDYRLTSSIDLRLSYNFRYLYDDNLDGISNSSINDQLWNLQGGIIVKNLFNRK